MKSLRFFGAREKDLSLQRTDDERVRAVVVSAIKHHSKIGSFDKNVRVLDGSEHLSMVANRSEVISSDESYLLDESSDLGSMGEILGAEGNYLDTDSEYEYDEGYGTSVKTNRPEEEETLVGSDTSAQKIDIFTLPALKLFVFKRMT